MKFRAKPVNDLTDVTLDLEQLEQQGIFNDTALGGALAGKLPNPALATGTVLQLLSTGTTQKLASGSVAVTWPGASTASGTATITHGLATTPRVWCQATQVGSAAYWIVTVFNVGATTFGVQGHTVDGSTPAVSTTSSMYWFAIG